MPLYGNMCMKYRLQNKRSTIASDREMYELENKQSKNAKAGMKNCRMYITPIELHVNNRRSNYCIKLVRATLR